MADGALIYTSNVTVDTTAGGVVVAAADGTRSTLILRNIGSNTIYIGGTEALSIQLAMRAELPGYLLPRLVREIPGDIAKTPVF